MMMKNSIIYFYFVNDILFAFKQRDRLKIQSSVDKLKKLFTIKEVRDLK